MTIQPASEPGAVVVTPGRHEAQLLSPSSPFALSPILVPLDFSPCSPKALAYALPLANQFKAGLVILHVVKLFPVDYFFGVQSAMAANELRTST